MIEVFADRVGEDGRHTISRNWEPVELKKAIDLLVKYELDFGGDVLDESHEGLIIVKTRIFSKVDTTKFRGDPEEMGILWDLVESHPRRR